MSCIALQSSRPDLLLIPLENPQQVSAFDYGAHYSPKSPKFAGRWPWRRATGATIFRLRHGQHHRRGNAASRGTLEAQTHQTLDNIEALNLGQ